MEQELRKKAISRYLQGETPKALYFPQTLS